MELLRIKVKNFKLFKEKEIDIRNQQLLIIRGDNGSGKSSLICEALLYALYGKCESTRIQGRFVDDLIRIRANEMQVYVEFNYKGQYFEIIRKRKESGTPKSSYEIKVDGINQGKKNFDEITGVDYSTFLNTILISQGQMTEFLNIKPADRKKLITEFFDLKKYNDYAASAKSRNVIVKESINNLEDRKKELEMRIKDPEIIKNDLKKVTKDFKERNIIMDQIKESEEKIRKEFSLIRERDKEKGILLTKTEEKKKALVKKEEEIETSKKKLFELKEKIININDLKQLKTELDKNVIEKESLTEKHDEFKKLKYTIKNLEDQIERKTESLKTEISRDETNLKDLLKREKHLKLNINDANQSIKDLPALNKRKKELEIVQEEITKEEQKEKKYLEYTKNIEKNTEIIKLQEKQIKKDIETIERELQNKVKLQGEKEKLDSKIAATRNFLRDMQKNEEKFSLLEKNREKLIERITILRTEKENLEKSKIREEKEFKPILKLGIGAKCPHCKQKLNLEHVNKLKVNFENKIGSLEKEIDSKVIESKEKAIQAAKFKKELQELKLQIKKQQEGSKELEVVKIKLETISRNLVDKKEQELQLNSLNNILTDKKYATEALTMLKDFKAQLISLSYDKKILDELKKEFKENPKIISEIARINEIDKNKTKNIDEMNSLVSQIQQSKKKLENNKNILLKGNHIKKDRNDLKDIIRKREALEEFEEKYLRSKDIIKKLRAQEIEKRYSEALSAKEEIVIRKEHEKNIEKEIKDINIKISEINKLLEPYFDVEQKIVDIKEKESHIIQEKDKMNNILMELKGNIVQLENDQKKNNVDINDRKKIEKKRESLSNEARITINLQSAFKEIVEQIFDRIKKDIGLQSSYLLRKLSNGNLPEISFGEGFNLTIPFKNEERHIEFFSGGQKTRIAMAFRVAVSQIIAKITETSLDTLIIDEGDFGSLDRDGRDAIGEILPKLVDSGFKKVIVITHINEIAENFPDVTFNL